MQDFICTKTENFPDSGSVCWTSPSNIALIKYWGKKPVQIPANSSLSFTLNECYTKTKIDFKKSAEFKIKLFVDGAENVEFLEKIETFLTRIKQFCPYIFTYKLSIHTENTFPHSSGIASSASGMSALALCLISIERIACKLSENEFLKKASFISRLGSGSACRSVYGPIGVWGKHPSFFESNDEFAVAYNSVHPIFTTFQDTILLVDKGKKQVSSTLGHQLMNNHPFSELRYDQAKENLEKLKKILTNGDITSFIQLVESEALTLHAMMMTSSPYFILMKPNTLSIIHEIWEFRKSKKVPLCVTLDAGANIHLLYPEQVKSQVLEFVEDNLVVFCENQQYICDSVGNGPNLLKEHYA